MKKNIIFILLLVTMLTPSIAFAGENKKVVYDETAQFAQDLVDGVISPRMDDPNFNITDVTGMSSINESTNEPIIVDVRQISNTSSEEGPSYAATVIQSTNVTSDQKSYWNVTYFIRMYYNEETNPNTQSAVPTVRRIQSLETGYLKPGGHGDYKITSLGVGYGMWGNRYSTTGTRSVGQEVDFDATTWTSLSYGVTYRYFVTYANRYYEVGDSISGIEGRMYITIKDNTNGATTNREIDLLQGRPYGDFETK